MLLSISHNKARIFHKPSYSSGLETEALFGENFKVIKREGCWVFGSLITDKYSGWMKSCKLGPYITSTHKVSVIRSHIYDSPSTKAMSIMPVSLGSRMKVLDQDKIWAEIEMNNNKKKRGFLPTKHLSSTQSNKFDWVEIAKSFIDTPYVWGGRSSFGIDCSGLIQLSLDLIGISFPRNSSHQFNFLKKNIINASEVRRGDLIYWKDHIGILISSKKILHSNGYHMKVAEENLSDAISRIGKGIFIRL